LHVNKYEPNRLEYDSEKVRYLSKEERLNSPVKIDEGRLAWAKNGARIDTTEKYKDNIHGIVLATDLTPPYVEPDAEAATGLQSHDLSTDETLDSSTAATFLVTAISPLSPLS
jgi:hypothetical protein